MCCVNRSILSSNWQKTFVIHCGQYIDDHGYVWLSLSNTFSQSGITLKGLLQHARGWRWCSLTSRILFCLPRPQSYSNFNFVKLLLPTPVLHVEAVIESLFLLQLLITHTLLQETGSVTIILQAHFVLDTHQLCLRPSRVFDMQNSITTSHFIH